MKTEADVFYVFSEGPDAVVSDTVGFADLVVLINPALEAARYATLSEMPNERRRYFESQLPVLAVLTSEDDDATGLAFPLGRWFSTLFETERDAQRLNPVTGRAKLSSRAVSAHPRQFRRSLQPARAGKQTSQVAASRLKAQCSSARIPQPGEILI